MELVQGHTLKDQIVQQGRFDEDRALNIILTVAKALQSAWEKSGRSSIVTSSHQIFSLPMQILSKPWT